VYQNGCHTYILPFNALDITRALHYTDGDAPEDYQFVVECSVFGFANGFIDKNNYVLVRKFNGRGLSYDGNIAGNVETTGFELAGVNMVLPCPAGYHDQVYAAYNRTVYQGDPFMSRNGTKTDGDYENRYGQLSMGAQFQMRTPIQQFDANGNFIPETPNLRTFEVLASLDFYTTMGTGKIGGALQAGTILDVGHTESTEGAALRASAGAVEPAWRVVTRTFTEGQKNNPARAHLDLIFASRFLDPSGYPEWAALNQQAGAPYTTGQYATIQFLAPGEVSETFWFCFTSNVSDLTGAGILLENIIELPEPAVTENDPDFTPYAAKVLHFTRQTIESHPVMKELITVVSPTVFSNTLRFEAIASGTPGNAIQARLAHVQPPGATQRPITEILNFGASNPVGKPQGAFITTANFSGGVDLPLNAGDGTSQINLGGMIERLPLGALLQDSDFLCENPLGDNASAVKSSPTGPRPVQSLIPFTGNGGEFDRFFGEPGQLIAMSDGTTCISDFSAYRTSSPGGTKRFRLFRGGGPLFVSGGESPGGPVDWASDSIPASLKPVLKGGLLACRALLVRNFREEVLPAPYKVSDGDELQMVVMTRGIFGTLGTYETGINLGGAISPAGYGEGWVAADRFRLEGKPLLRGYNRNVPNPADVEIAPYPDNQQERTVFVPLYIP
jgi:hypothetical protein